jgi:hypothetical protein
VRLLTEDAKLVCVHRMGKVSIAPGQPFVTIAQRLVLVETDPERRDISGCPMFGAGIRPCKTTLKVDKGYSAWLWIDGKRICLDTVTGLTDGSPPGKATYLVAEPGQDWVSEA